MTQICEVLRAWLSGAGLRRVGEQAGVDRKTARRYVEAAVAAGLVRDGGIGQLTDGLVGQVAEVVRPARPGGHGLAWEQLDVHHADIEALAGSGWTSKINKNLAETVGWPGSCRPLTGCGSRCRRASAPAR